MVSRMFEIYGETEVMRLSIEVRHEAVFELAQLMLWLGAWSPTGATIAVAAASLASIAAQLRPRPPQAAVAA